MAWINGIKVKDTSCKFCGSEMHRGWQCPERPTKPRSMSPERQARVKKKPSRATLIKKYDELFSKYIRLKAQVEHNLYCYTCGKRLTYDTAVAMHFINRRYVSVRFNTDNVKVGCFKCNTPDKDQPLVLARYAELLGEETVAELEMKKHQRLSTPELEEQYENCKRLYATLQELSLLI